MKNKLLFYFIFYFLTTWLFKDTPFTETVTLNKTNPRYFAFSSKKIFLPIGLNLSWVGTNDPLYKPGENSVENYKKYFEKLNKNGVNLIRIWIAPWNLPLEHKGLKPGAYDLNNIKQLKKIFTEAKKKNIYIILCIDSFNLYRTSQNYPAWEENVYQVKYGGFLKKPWQFFVQEEAKNYHKKKLQFLISQLSQFDNLFCWELFNEIDLTEYFLFQKEDIKKWIKEMAQYLHNNDPNHHLVTISFAEANFGKEFFENITELDFVSIHKYGTPAKPLKNIYGELFNLNNDFLKFKKPVLLAEFGLDWEGKKNAEDKKGIHLHNALWSSIFLNFSATAMLWWWDSYIEKYNLYYQFKAPARFIKQYVNYNFINGEFLNWQVSSNQLNVLGKNFKDKNIFIWVQNKTHNWFDVLNKNNNKSYPTLLKIKCKDTSLKTYKVIFYDTTEFKIIKKFTAKKKGIYLEINLPTILSDLVIIANC